MFADCGTDISKIQVADDIVADGNTSPPGGGFLLQGDNGSFITQDDGSLIIIGLIN